MKLCIFLGTLALFLYLKHMQRSKICAELPPGVFDPAAIHLLNATCVCGLKYMELNSCIVLSVHLDCGGTQISILCMYIST